MSEGALMLFLWIGGAITFFLIYKTLVELNYLKENDQTSILIAFWPAVIVGTILLSIILIPMMLIAGAGMLLDFGLSKIARGLALVLQKIPKGKKV